MTPLHARRLRILAAPALAAAGGLFLAFASAAEPKPPAPKPADVKTLRFDKDIRPLLDTYCFKCHAGEKAKGDVSLSGVTDVAGIGKDPKTWRMVASQLAERAMPPANKPQPPEAQRQMLIQWIEQTLGSLDHSSIAKDPGRVTIRRLNRAEYNNTIRDLLGVTTNPADAFPADGGGGGGFDNNADTLFVPPILLEQYLKAAADVLRAAKPERLFAARPGDKMTKRNAAQRSVEAFASRAFRRPATPAEVNRYLTLFDAADGRGATYEESVRLALRGVLVAPQFLFRVEQDRPSPEPYRVSDHELASRLSYFLWSSMPDDELLKLAGEGKLKDDAVLEAQVKRMLRDPKARALAENVGTQWLTLRDLKGTIQPDRRKFKEYTTELRDAMYDEAIEFVGSVLREDVSLLTLLDADYTFVNEELAKHYGIPNVKGADLRRVKLTDANRGGLLGLGGVLTATSYPRRTSPVLRGRWVLDTIFGAPPPPPPPEAGELGSDDKQKDGLSFRQRLEKHREKPACASCHNRMDPLGFGLENFDAVGKWRSKDGTGNDVDSTGTLTTGESFKGPAELKKILLARKQEFARNVSEKMLAYALGRGLEFYDQPAVKRITEALSANDYRTTAMMVEIVKSYPFQYRRGSATASAE